MKKNTHIKLINKILPYLFITIITILTFFYIYRAWGFNFNLPYFYRGDALWNIASVKGFIEQKQFIENKNLGAPFGNNYYDYPSSETMFKIPIALLASFIKNPVIIINLYYLLTFVITSITSYFVLNYFKVSNNLAILASLVVSFLPYHLLKGISHINLSTYYLIPFVFLVLFWIFDNQIFKSYRSKKNNKLLWSIIITILIANNGIYYAFFTTYFLVITGIISSFKHRKIKNLLFSILLSFVIFLTVLINILPNINHQIKSGKNQAVAARSYSEAEYYGLKVIELFLPTSNFKSSLIKKYKDRYYNFTLTKSEKSSYLGIIGSIGFILLLMNLFSKKTFDKKINFLSYLNLSALILAIPTGLGTMIGYLSSQIRVYARISIFINIFAVFALIFFIDKYIKKYSIHKILLNSILIVVFCFAVVDQGRPKEINAKGVSDLFYNDKKFVQKIERDLNFNAMVFQLPYKAFPESIAINQLTDYDLFRPYIHSNNLKWSYGIIKGTSQDRWMKTISELPLEQMVETVAIAGYKGIYYDTVGYSDRGKELEDGLSSILKEKPLKSDLEDLVFFNLSNYQQQLITEHGEDVIDKRRKQIFSLPIMIVWDKGFYSEEKNGKDSWHWSKQESNITLINESQDVKNFNLEFYPVSNNPEMSNLYIESDLFSQQIEINAEKRLFTKSLKIPHGKFKISFKTDSRKYGTATEARDLYFRIFNFELKELF
ncbi:MAG: hypothetical protein ABIJ83_00080 [Patescibacteria group bacterium]